MKLLSQRGEEVMSYKYLGFVIIANGSLSKIVEELAVSARKALHTLSVRAGDHCQSPLCVIYLMH